MTPPTISIRKCLYCGNLFGTSNYDGFIHLESGMPWTDGDFSDDIQLPNFNLYQCAVCMNKFQIEQSEIVGLDNLDVIVKNGLVFGEIPVDSYFWHLNIPSLKGYKGSSIKHNVSTFYDYYLPLKGLPPNYKRVESYYPITPDFNEMLETQGSRGQVFPCAQSSLCFEKCTKKDLTRMVDRD